MSRRVLLVIAALSLTALVVGGRMGLRIAGLDETDAIAAVAARYVAETGGAPTDCVARAGEGRLWLVVRCEGPRVRSYGITHWGNPVDIVTDHEDRT